MYLSVSLSHDELQMPTFLPQKKMVKKTTPPRVVVLPPYQKKRIPATVKRLVWNQYVGEEIGKTKCYCCQLSDITQMTFHCGHVLSERYGGDTDIQNLRPICQSCNSSMGTTNMEDFITLYQLHPAKQARTSVPLLTTPTKQARTSVPLSTSIPKQARTSSSQEEGISREFRESFYQWLATLYYDGEFKNGMIREKTSELMNMYVIFLNWGRFTNKDITTSVFQTLLATCIEWIPYDILQDQYTLDQKKILSLLTFLNIL